MSKWWIILGFWLLSSLVSAEGMYVIKVSVLSNNEVLVNGKPVSPSEFIEALSIAQDKQGGIWYFRQNPHKEPPPVAAKVFSLIRQTGLPVSMSTRSDFSDYIDRQGNIKLRKH